MCVFVCVRTIALCKRLEGGLDKLEEASVQLAELNEKLAEQKVVLAEKSSACEILLEEITTNTKVGQCQHTENTKIFILNLKLLYIY